MAQIDDIKARLDIGEFIGRSVKLQRAGRSLRGLCPFHQEKSPSFYVTPERGTWHCFGTCGVGGDIIAFVQKRDGLEFRDALKVLADAAGVQLRTENPEKRARVDRLAGAVSAAVEFYQAQLGDSLDAWGYLGERRGLTPATVGEWRLGWAPEEWRALRAHLRGRGYSDAEQLAAGLLVQGEHNSAPYDRFRSRCMFPIADARGVFVGFAGRTLGSEGPKYINSPEGELFTKGAILYGLDMATPGARAAGELVLVEGQMDVIGPWQAGFRNVAATMGTALTPTHAAQIKRIARRVVLALDPDSAGVAAVERAGPLLAGADVELVVAALPAGQDPDSLARANPDAWRAAIAGAVPYVDFAIVRVLPDSRPRTSADLRALMARVRAVVDDAPGPIERERVVQLVSQRLGMPEPIVWNSLRGAPDGPGRREPAPQRRNYRAEMEARLLGVLTRPELHHFAGMIDDAIFEDAGHREALRALQEGEALDPELAARLDHRGDVYGAEEAVRMASDLERELSRLLRVDRAAKALDAEKPG